MTSSDSSDSTDLSASAAGSIRFIRDDTHRTWTVRELVASYDRRQAPSLVFSTDDVMRRVRDYPSNWRTLSDEELYALSLGH